MWQLVLIDMTFQKIGSSMQEEVGTSLYDTAQGNDGLVCILI